MTTTLMTRPRGQMRPRACAQTMTTSHRLLTRCRQSVGRQIPQPLPTGSNVLFRFEPTALASGLRLIEEIPDQRLCRLEGRNGIGKTMAVRLLELVTGGQPYAGLDLTWQSL